jgi:hypothetical protein
MTGNLNHLICAGLTKSLVGAPCAILASSTTESDFSDIDKVNVNASVQNGFCWVRLPVDLQPESMCCTDRRSKLIRRR